jgi:hypothetical protein
MTNLQQEIFLGGLDETIKEFYDMGKSVIDDTETIEVCVNKFTEIRNGSPLPIVWVKESNTPIKEFYPSELNLTWLVSYVVYYNYLLKDCPDKDLEKIKHACTFLAIALTKIKGINIIDGTVYLLQHDLEFVNYKLDRKLFI